MSTLNLPRDSRRCLGCENIESSARERFCCVSIALRGVLEYIRGLHGHELVGWEKSGGEVDLYRLLGQAISAKDADMYIMI